MNEEIQLYGPDGEVLEMSDGSSCWWAQFLTGAVICFGVAFLVISCFRIARGVSHTKDSGLTIIQAGAVSEWSVETVPAAKRERFSERHAPIDHPPGNLVVEGETYRFHYAYRRELLHQNCLGQTILDEKQIWLPVDEDGRTIRETVLHEMMHIALASAGGEFNNPVLKDIGDGEPVINPSARMLLTILRDNPKLAHWLERP